jgi:hypothetical protein
MNEIATTGGYTQTHSLMGWIKEIRCLNGLRCRDIHTTFRKDWFNLSKVDRGNTQTHRQHGGRISIFLFFSNKESNLTKQDKVKVEITKEREKKINVKNVGNE